MKIAVLIDELAKEGGGERQALYLARELQDMGHQVTVFTLAHDPPNCYPDVASQLDIVVTGRHPFIKGRFPPTKTIRDLLNAGHLARHVRGPFDVLNPHHWPAHWAAVQARPRIVPSPAVVWMCNDYPWQEDEFAWPSTRSLPGLLRPLFRLALRRYDRRKADAISRIVVLSHQVEEKIREGYGIESLVVRSGIDIHRFAHPHSPASVRIRLHYQIPAERFLLLFVGILMPHRRLEDLLDALHQLVVQSRPVHFLVVGSLDHDRAYATRLAALTRSLGLESWVTFAGSVSEADLPVHYSACDAFVFPNENQTWALAVTEAMASRKPVIVSTGCGVAEVLTHEENALLVPPRRPDLLALQIRRLMEDRGLAEAIGHAGYETVSRTLSWRRYAENMVQVFESASGKATVRHASSPASSHPGKTYHGSKVRI